MSTTRVAARAVGTPLDRLGGPGKVRGAASYAFEWPVDPPRTCTRCRQRSSAGASPDRPTQILSFPTRATQVSIATAATRGMGSPIAPARPDLLDALGDNLERLRTLVRDGVTDSPSGVTGVVVRNAAARR
jgi:hypothetical protein